MSNSAKKEYLQEIRKRYFLASRSEKTLVFDEFCAMCNLNRKYVIRLIWKKEIESLKLKKQNKELI